MKNNMKLDVKNTINNVWLAGLGVASLAQKETVKAYDSLIKEGKTLEKKSKKTAKDVSGQAEKRLNKIRNVANKQFNKVENLFETRIESVLKKFEIPTTKDINSLSKKVDSLVKEIKNTKAA